MESEIKTELFGTRGFGWRVALSILVVFGWVIFLIIWLFFYAGDFDVFQNIAIFIASVLAGIGILAATWASWGIRFAKTHGFETPKECRPSWPNWASGVAFVGWLIFLIIWLFYYAGDFTGYQNLAIFLLSLLVLAGIAGGAWALWGTRWGEKKG